MRLLHGLEKDAEGLQQVGGDGHKGLQGGAEPVQALEKVIHKGEVLQARELVLGRPHGDHVEGVRKRLQHWQGAHRLCPEVYRPDKGPCDEALHLLRLRNPLLFAQLEATLTSITPLSASFALSLGCIASMRRRDASVPEYQRELPQAHVTYSVGGCILQAEQLYDAVLHEAEGAERAPCVSEGSHLRKGLQQGADHGLQLGRVRSALFLGHLQGHSGGVSDEEERQEACRMRCGAGPDCATTLKEALSDVLERPQPR
mmetsp:Transcript_93822/g.209652  ORF Transcript_93822/g.209652 Transcript_93822/m.209652 type:complete len:258 (-) Transcript_93822:1020-1793(-)